MPVTAPRLQLPIRAAIVALAVGAAMIVASCGRSDTEAPPAQRAEASTQPQSAPSPPDETEPPDTSTRRAASYLDFTLRGVNGRPVKLGAMRGKPVILDFWATWCGPCRREMPELNRIYDQYRAQGLEVIGISVDTIKGDGVRAVAPFIKQFGIKYPIVMADQDMVDRLGVFGIPTTLFIDPAGELVARIDGVGAPGMLRTSAEKLMKSAKAPRRTKPAPGEKQPETADI